jgi:hypothetical protein
MSTTITYIATPEPWESGHGTMYQANVKLEDGTEGQINMKSPDRWKVGDSVEVIEKKETPYGNRLKIQKPGGFQAASGPRKSDPDVQRHIAASWAIGQAVNRLDALADISEVDTKNKIYKDAMSLLEIHDSVLKSRS